MNKNKHQIKEAEELYDCLCWCWYWEAVKWYRLEAGEIIKKGDLLGVLPGDGTVEWTYCDEVGKPAPDPKDLTDRTYRRVTYESPAVKQWMRAHHEFH